MPDCLDKTQKRIVDDAMEDFITNLDKELRRETDPEVVELYQDVLDNADATSEKINSIACVAMKKRK